MESEAVDILIKTLKGNVMLPKDKPIMMALILIAQNLEEIKHRFESIDNSLKLISNNNVKV